MHQNLHRILTHLLQTHLALLVLSCDRSPDTTALVTNLKERVHALKAGNTQLAEELQTVKNSLR